MEKKILSKILAICLLAVTLSPMAIMVVQSKLETGLDYPVINGEDPTLHKFIMYEKGALGALIDIDSYHFEMKEGKTYIIRAKFDIEAGGFTILLGGPGGSDVGAGSWAAEDPKSERKVELYFTPTSDGDHSISILSVFLPESTTYTIYVNQDGFAGWWWMLAIGVGALLIVILVVVVIARARKPKRRRKKIR